MPCTHHSRPTPGTLAPWHLAPGTWHLAPYPTPATATRAAGISCATLHRRNTLRDAIPAAGAAGMLTWAVVSYAGGRDEASMCTVHT